MAASAGPVQRAFDDAMADFKKQLKDPNLYDEILKTKSIDEVHDLTKKIQDDQGKTGSLRNLSKITPYLTRLTKFADTIKSIHVKPDAFALIWGPIKLLLHWTSNLTHTFDAILDIIKEVGEALPEFTEMAQLFANNSCIKDVLVLFFKEILDFYVVALNFFGLPRIRGTASKMGTGARALFEALWPQHKQKILLIRKHIKQHTSLIRSEVRLEHIRLAYDLRDKALEHFERTETANQRAEYSRIRENIKPQSHEALFASYHARICTGTGDWLLRDASFMQWFDPKNTTIKMLWLRGIPGAGKSYLTTTVIDAALTPDHTVGYAILKYNEQNTVSALSVLHSLIFQMTQSRDDLQAVICKSTGVRLKSHLEEAAELLKTVLDCAGASFIIVDGLDEIDSFERSALIKQLVRLGTECTETKVLFSSRTEENITFLLKDKTFEIDVHSRNSGSIQKFVNWRKTQWCHDRGFRSDFRNELDGLLAPLAANAKGMFLFARIVLDTVRDLISIKEIRDQLRCPPKNLREAYGRVFEKINLIDSDLTRTRTRKILGWIGCTPTPLTYQETQQALNIQDDSSHDYESDSEHGLIHDPIIYEDFPIQCCGPIVEVVDNYIQFVHFTVHEYLFSTDVPNSISFSAALLDLAATAATYLIQRHHDPDLRDEEVEDYIVTGAYRLHAFASSYWLQLAIRYFNAEDSSKWSRELLEQLNTLLCTRSSSAYESQQRPTTSSDLNLSLTVLSQDWRELQDMLYNVRHFHNQSSQALYSLQQETRWTQLDPLTISKTSIAIHKGFDRMPCVSTVHVEDCVCRDIPRIYGPAPFKCPILSCSHRRRGFSTKSERNSHVRHHDKPWKCDIENCEYASVGFISRRMRNDHLEESHKQATAKPTLSSTSGVLDQDELQPLLFDLVRADKVAQVRQILPSLVDPTGLILKQLRELAAGFASGRMIKVLLPIVDYSIEPDFMDLASEAARAGNAETSEYLAEAFDKHQYRYFGQKGKSTLRYALMQDSEVVWTIWEKTVLKFSGVGFRREIVTAAIMCPTIAGTANSELLEKRLKDLWLRLMETEHFSTYRMSMALVNVGHTTCSVNLATMLIKHGANINHQFKKTAATPLQAAAAQDSLQAATFMQFLLSQGADPACTRRKITLKRRPGEHSLSVDRNGPEVYVEIAEERGPRGISRWLGITWDELVAQTASARQGKDDEPKSGISSHGNWSSEE